LANRIRSYRDAQKKAVQDFNEWRGQKHPARAFEAIYLEGTEQIRFEGADVAGDCFHLSAKGQGKVASAILPALK
jgi:lysophospholipase L1-like esterase